jgi:hypothetical protein
MDNFDFVEHLASTAHAFDLSAEIVESFVRSYYREMQAVAAKWENFDHHNHLMLQRAFSELNAIFRKYWLMETRFAEYWEPALCSPAEYVVSAESGLTVFADMLGNFVVIVRTEDRICVYLLAVVNDELKIVNEFFN